MNKKDIITISNELYNMLEDFESSVNDLKEELKKVLRKAEDLPSDLSDIEEEDKDDE